MEVQGGQSDAARGGKAYHTNDQRDRDHSRTGLFAPPMLDGVYGRLHFVSSSLSQSRSIAFAGATTVAEARLAAAICSTSRRLVH
jgi:hypothetical protein